MPIYDSCESSVCQFLQGKYFVYQCTLYIDVVTIGELYCQGGAGVSVTKLRNSSGSSTSSTAADPRASVTVRPMRGPDTAFTPLATYLR